jgi:hypothetical protein
MEFFVLKPILMFVFLNNFVMRYVSFPVYVKVAHLGVGVGVFFGPTAISFLGFKCGFGVGKPLLCRMLVIVEVSVFRWSPCMLYVCSLL